MLQVTEEATSTDRLSAHLADDSSGQAQTSEHLTLEGEASCVAGAAGNTVPTVGPPRLPGALDLFKLGGPSVKNHPVVCPQDYGLFITGLDLPYFLNEIADSLRY